MTDIRDIERAAGRLEGVAVETPLLSNRLLDEIAGGKVLVKPECLQVTGTFKIRGAYNFLSQLNAEESQRGVVAFSSGNHAQGVAAAGTMLGIRTAIVMPEDAPRAKLENTRRLGGEVITYDRYTGDREAIARRIAAERGAIVVPSYDHEYIIAGQGTVGLEIARQCAALGIVPDQVLVNCGGGGLIAGTATALKAHNPGIDVHPVEPEGFDDTARSLRSGKREHADPAARSICDALQAHTPGEMTFAINRALLGDGLVVSDTEVRAAMRFAFANLKLVVEPGGAVSLAAVLSGKIRTRDRTTVVVISGGNVDNELFAEIQREASG
ncbi:MAG: threonine/serine dehydratase [Gammaproteobacteria bacterium]|nr:threonine/serine dehydratase [Gammaproteobacteria bacterium]MDH5619038.1 threonine/serine dehydratase [Gammaproteobacteria bacterium]